MAQAKAQNITSAAYDAAITDHQNIEKYYETITGLDEKVTRRRRENVFPPSLVGLHRPIYSVPRKRGASPVLLYYERYLLTTIFNFT